MHLAIRKFTFAIVTLAATAAAPLAAQVVTTGLIQDLNADLGVTAAGTNVSSWVNQAAMGGDSVNTNNGSPQLVSGAVNGHNAISFSGSARMAGSSLTAFDANINGSGYTWIAVLNPDNNPGVKNQIFGTLVNGSPFSGQTAGIGNSTNSAYTMYRTTGDQFTSGTTQNLAKFGYHVIAGRLAAGTGSQLQEIFVNGSLDGSGNVTVSGSNDAGAIVLGAERISGDQYFDGDIARLLIYDRPLTASEMSQTASALFSTYNIDPTKATFLSWSFENGLADDQTGDNVFTSTSGTAFESQPVQYSNTDASNPFGGDSFLVRTDFRADGSPNKPGDGPQGVMESGVFTVPEFAVLTVDAAGNGGMLQLIEDGTGDVLATITPGLTSTTLGTFDLDISEFTGMEAFLRATDNSSGGWGHIALDNITISGIAQQAVVPEPSTMWMWSILGLLGIVYSARLRVGRVNKPASSK